MHACLIESLQITYEQMFNRHTRNAEILLGNPCMISTISLKQSECISEHLRSVCTVLHVIYSIVRGHIMSPYNTVYQQNILCSLVDCKNERQCHNIINHSMAVQNYKALSTSLVPRSASTGSMSTPCLRTGVVLLDSSVGVHSETNIRMTPVFLITTAQQVNAEEVLYFVSHFTESYLQ